jgi:dienelactone hydrolase
MQRAVAFLCCLLLAAASARSDEAVRRGEIDFRPTKGESTVPERFRLAEHRFAFEQRPQETAATKIRLSEVTFPSPVKTLHEVNNTVHCEYFRPVADGKYPGVIVLHILGGDFDLCRLMGRTLSHHGVCALFVKMPYYGPRRPPDLPVRMISVDPKQSVAGMQQAVLDIRRATAWLAAQGEVDGGQLGVFGISLGAITGALAAECEPRLQSVFLVMAGGDIGKVGANSPYAAIAQKKWLESGGTIDGLVEALRPIDPATYGKNLRGRRVTMVNARYDEIIPRECTLSLWKAAGEPEIIWHDCGHYSMGRFLFDVMARATKFYQPRAAGRTAR